MLNEEDKIKLSGKTVIFIGGHSYSGSTMLDMMLANKPEGFSLGEVSALFRPYRPHHYASINCICEKNCNLWRKFKSGGEECIYENVFKADENLRYIVDSSKDPAWISKQSRRLKSMGWTVKNVLIWKDPSLFKQSMTKRGRIRSANAWESYYKNYLLAVDEFLPIKYTELVAQPEELLKRITQYCGVAYRRDMEKFWQKVHHTVFGNDSAKTHLANKREAAIYVPRDESPSSAESTKPVPVFTRAMIKLLEGKFDDQEERRFVMLLRRDYILRLKFRVFYWLRRFIGRTAGYFVKVI